MARRPAGALSRITPTGRCDEGTAPSPKRTFARRSDAKLALKRTRASPHSKGGRLDVYACGDPPHYHVGHPSPRHYPE